MSSGEYGKYASPSPYPHTSPEKRYDASHSRVSSLTTPSRVASASSSNVKASIASRARPTPATTP